MEIQANTSITNIVIAGNKARAFTAQYFDKDNNKVLDAEEVKLFNASAAEIDSEAFTIKHKDQTFVFPNMRKMQSAEYYLSGQIPVAVVDDFTDIIINHGIFVSNIIKKNNPDISISPYNIAAHKETQQAIINALNKNPATMFALINNPKLKDEFCEQYNAQETQKKILKSFQKIKEDIDGGKKYKAINLSLSLDMPYEEINLRCFEKLGVEITPENIAQYKNQIKKILQEDLSTPNGTLYNTISTKGTFSMSMLLSIIEAMEKTAVPIYVAQSYKYKDFSEQSFNLFSLADNARTVEAGTISDDGKINSHLGSTNSFAIDEKTKKRRIQNSFMFIGNGVLKDSTSAAAPAMLAQELK